MAFHYSILWIVSEIRDSRTEAYLPKFTSENKIYVQISIGTFRSPGGTFFLDLVVVIQVARTSDNFLGRGNISFNRAG